MNNYCPSTVSLNVSEKESSKLQTKRDWSYLKGLSSQKALSLKRSFNLLSLSFFINTYFPAAMFWIWAYIFPRCLRWACVSELGCSQRNTANASKSSFGNGGKIRSHQLWGALGKPSRTSRTLRGPISDLLSAIAEAESYLLLLLEKHKQSRGHAMQFVVL